MIDLFISHATADDATVDRIHEALSKAGIETWVDHQRGIEPGDNWSKEIHDAANACERGLFVLSPASARSEYCEAEWNRILARRKKLYIAMIKAVPLQDIPLRLGIIQYADLTRDFKDGMDNLIQAMQGKRDLDPGATTTKHARRITGRFPYSQLDLPLIGRDADRTKVENLLSDPKARTVTILGLGGVGKSRLAVEIANTAAFTDGVVWHTMTRDSTVDQLTWSIRDHLDLDVTTGADTTWDELGKHQTLLVLDNAEDCQQPKAYADRLNELNLGGGARILVTSRRGWSELRNVKPHGLKAPDAAAAVDILKAMATNEPPAYPLDGCENQIAEAAQHHPKLMWYAVRWANSYPPDYVLQALRTLEGTDAEEALDDMVKKTVRQVAETKGGPEAIAALRRLAVCRGGFTFEAAQAIMGEKADPHLLALLKQWGLVSLEGGRYEVDPLVTAAVGEDETAHQAHYDYYKVLARKHREKQDYLGLDGESANLEAAFEWTLGVGKAENAYWLANACEDFLSNRGRFRQHVDWIVRVAAVVKDDSDDHLRGAVQASLGIAYGNMAELEEPEANLKRAIAVCAEALRFYTPQTALWNYAITQNNLGLAYWKLAELEEPEANLKQAVAAFKEALRFRTPQAVPLNYATTQNNLGIAYGKLAELEEPEANLKRAVAAFKEALHFWNPQTAPLDHAMTQNNLGNAYGDLAGVEDQEVNLKRAITAYTEALRFRTPETAPLDYARTQANLGIVQKKLGDLSSAITCWREAERYFRQLGWINDADKMLTRIADSGG